MQEMSGFENIMGLQHENEGILNSLSSGLSLRTNVSEMAISSISVAKPSHVANLFLDSSDWDLLVSSSHVQTFGSSPMVSHTEFANSSYPLVQYISDSNVEDMVPKVRSYGSGSYIEVDPGFAPSENRRKRGLDYNSTLSSHKNVEGDSVKDSSGKNFDGVKEQDEKKQKVEQNKDNSHSVEAPIENFVHVRAGRGQATNSHSLAERVRREKISERMRFLQELVPGCKKITGKAVMLDEIINYVQSLQQQVEFLSMKLATVNPELNFDVVERILSKDILQSRITHRPIGGYGPSINCSHPFPSGSFQGTSTLFPGFYGMSYDSSTAVDNLASNETLELSS